MRPETLAELSKFDGLGEAFTSIARRDLLIAGLAVGAAAALPARVALAQAAPASKAAAASAVAAVEDAILRITQEVWDLAEI